MERSISLSKANGYVNIANRGGYVIWGTDGLKGYTHKLYLILYREDYGKTIEKTLARFLEVESIKLSISEYNMVVGTENAKIIAIKNKGISEQIIKLLRGEDGKSRKI